jgi:sec-independent protein translocase protein TatA
MALLRPVSSVIPLQVGVPGGPELLIVLLVAVVLFGIPIVLLAGGLVLYRRMQSDDPAGEEVEALRREVRRLREEIDELNDEK